MGGKYEIRYYDKESVVGYTTIYTNRWLEFIALKLTKKIIYYKIYK